MGLNLLKKKNHIREKPDTTIALRSHLMISKTRYSVMVMDIRDEQTAWGGALGKDSRDLPRVTEILYILGHGSASDGCVHTALTFY